MLKAAHNTMAQLTDDCNEAEKAQLELTGKVDSLQRELQVSHVDVKRYCGRGLSTSVVVCNEMWV